MNNIELDNTRKTLEGLYGELSRIRTGPEDWEGIPEAFHHALREAEDSVRVYPADDGNPVVSTAHLADDISSIIHRLDLVRGGAWQAPGLTTCIGPEDLTALAARLKTAALSVARQGATRKDKS